MAKNTSITLSDHFETIIENSISSGRYASASEVIRAGLRKIDEEEQKITALRNATVSYTHLTLPTILLV